MTPRPKISKIGTVCRYVLCVIFCLLLSTLASLAYADVSDPCGGENSLLALLDRPTTADSACVVKPDQVVGEFGSQFQSFTDGTHGYDFPESVLRFGLPHNNELVFLPPDYIHQNSYGFGPASLGLKHEFGYTARWLAAGEALVTLPSGSSELGSANVGSAVNGIATYSITPTLDLTGMFGVTSQTTASANGGQRFNSFNPDIVLTWQTIPVLQFYAEIYAQTQPAPGQGFGCNFDGGVQYLPKKFLELDISEGVRLTGNLDSLNNYFAFGIGVLFI